MAVSLVLEHQPNSAVNNPLAAATGDTQVALEAWYIGASQSKPGSQSETSIAIAGNAFQRAMQFHQATFTHKHLESWLSSSSSMSDVLVVLQESHLRYEAKKSSRSKGLSHAGSWWKIASSRITHYGQVVDTFVSSNPEYAALVWGALRFLFQVTLNHEELSAKIAQALAEIGSVLPEVDFIACKLYPIERIKDTLAQAYVQIIEFCILATKWYNDVCRNRLRKVWHAIANPWPLKFEGIKMNIDACFKRLREQSTLAHQAETRVIHTKISEMLTIRAAGGPLKTDATYGPVRFTVPISGATGNDPPVLISFEKISVYFESMPFDPTQAFDNALMMRDRRRARGHALLEALWTSPTLQTWVSSPASAILRVNDSFNRREATVDFALDMIQMARAAGVPVVWYLGVDAQRRPVSAADVLRSLVRQVVEAPGGRAARAAGLREEHFGRCETAEDWLLVLVALAATFGRLALVVDAREGADGILGFVARFRQKLDARRTGAVCKILVLTCGATLETASALSMSSSADQYAELDMDLFGQNRVSRVAYSPRGRPRGSRSGGQMPDQLKLSVQRLWDQRGLVHTGDRDP